MPCDTRTRVRTQTLSERAQEVRDAVASLEKLLLRRQVRVVVGPQGAITFSGWSEQDRADISDACAYRRIMATGSSIAKLEIMRAEQMAGVSVNRQVVNAGVHSHDGGRSWHDKG